MEELGHSRHIHMDYDLWICINHLRRPLGLDDYGSLANGRAHKLDTQLTTYPHL